MNYQNVHEAHQTYSLLEERLLKRIIVHLLRNFAFNHSASVSVLLNALAVGQLTASEDVQGLMHSMKRSSEQIGRFLNALTDVASPESRRPSELFVVAKQAGDLLEAALLRRNICFDVAVDESLLLDIPSNVATLALANLIENAKDAMSCGGRIRIEAETHEGLIWCRVIDQGDGIAEAIRDKIFDDGFTTKGKNGENAGQGLPLTRALLLKNLSSIELTETSSEGSTFTIYFPGVR